jgi:hypothetical protein
MGGHSQRHRGDADAHHRADLRGNETRPKRPGRDGARGRKTHNLAGAQMSLPAKATPPLPPGRSTTS